MVSQLSASNTFALTAVTGCYPVTRIIIAHCLQAVISGVVYSQILNLRSNFKIRITRNKNPYTRKILS